MEESHSKIEAGPAVPIAKTVLTRVPMKRKGGLRRRGVMGSGH